MTDIPAGGFLSNAARTEGEMKTAFEDQRDAITEQPGGAAISTLTIAGGAVTPTAALHLVDTEAAAAADDLDNIATTNHPAGRILYLRSVDAGRVVTVRHAQGGAGQVYLADAANRALTITEALVLAREGADWREVSAEARALLHAASTSNPHSVTKSQVGLGNVENLKVNLAAVVAPTVNEDSGDGYAIGSRWIDTAANKEYVALDVTVGAAVWTETTQAGGGGGGAFSSESFDADGNFTVPAGITTLYLSGAGAGAGGGGSDNASFGGSGGGSGEASVDEAVTVTPLEVIAVGIGVGGAAGTGGGGGTAGGNGTATTFGAYRTWAGGTGGQPTDTGMGGATGGPGGSDGGGGLYCTIPGNTVGLGGHGGSNIAGGVGGAGSTFGTAAGGDGIRGGGGGGGGSNSAAASNGGAGGAGFVVVRW